MLTLGIPSNPTMALMIGALMIQGIAPGPQVMTERPELFWGLVASMWVGNLMLLVLNLPLIGLWVKLLAVPYRLLFPAIFVFCCIGVFTVDNKIFDVYVLAALERRRLCAAQARLRAGAAHSRLHPRPDDGGADAPRHDDHISATSRSSSPGRSRPASWSRPLLLMLLIALPSLRAKREVALQE